MMQQLKLFYYMYFSLDDFGNAFQKAFPKKFENFLFFIFALN